LIGVVCVFECSRREIAVLWRADVRDLILFFIHPSPPDYSADSAVKNENFIHFFWRGRPWTLIGQLIGRFF